MQEREEVYYRVQTGAFRNRENALRQQEKLSAEGYPAFLVENNGYYLVQVGAFRKRKMQFVWKLLCVKMVIRPTLPREEILKILLK